MRRVAGCVVMVIQGARHLKQLNKTKVKGMKEKRHEDKAVAFCSRKGKVLMSFIFIFIAKWVEGWQDVRLNLLRES